MKAGILTIGDEIISGFSVDTNSVWLAQELLKRGITTLKKASVGDDPEAIREVLARWDGKLDLVIATGGLGPTHDDITKTAFCQYFNSELRFDEGYWELLIERFKKRGYDIPANNRAQAEIPIKSVAIPNPVGTAPGLQFRSGTTTFYVLPGVPTEMKAIMTEQILPEMGSGDMVPILTLRTTGIIESALAEKLKHVVSALKGIQVAYLPAYTGVDIRLRALEPVVMTPDVIESAAGEIESILGDLVYARGDTTLEEVVGKLLKERKETLALAESCSGGLASSRITDIPGSSAYMLGAVVAYSNEAKIRHLSVDADTLKAHGAVSEATAREMAEGVKSVFNAHWGVATTGISGPTGGTTAKPVGLVFTAVAGIKRTVVREARLVPHRLPHKAAASQVALNLLRLEILHHG
ncbi:MAG: CinA family nicotinamide mononucleotide deamidase-related protein [Fidelibacterota bacterium]|nr:MAG: CinA family nicotinamide mononucleotide deamidase-related protein [Candidatus Neomarinimicrobiota bacterium]